MDIVGACNVRTKDSIAPTSYRQMKDEYEEFDPVSHGLDSTFRLTGLTKLKG